MAFWWVFTALMALFGALVGYVIARGALAIRDVIDDESE